MTQADTSNRNVNGCCRNGDKSNKNSSTLTLIDIIVSDDDEIRHCSLSDYCRGKSLSHLLQQCEELDEFRRRCNDNNLYHTVRALFFLYALHRYHLIDAAAADSAKEQEGPQLPSTGLHPIPYSGYQCLLERSFAKAVDVFLVAFRAQPTVAHSSALATAYYQLAFQTLAQQVHRAVEHHPGNPWMFVPPPPTTTTQHYQHPLVMRSELLLLNDKEVFPIVQEETPVRMDLSHCGWSDIFFLGMDFPEGARVLNASINLSVRQNISSNTISEDVSQQQHQKPPISSYLQVIPEPGVLRLTSIDLQCSVCLTHVSQVFDFGRDHVGLLRAGVVAAGIVPPGWQPQQRPDGEVEEDVPLSVLFTSLMRGRADLGLHLVTHVHNIPKGSRLAVSTNLLASIIAVGMRATGQTAQLVGTLREEERRLVAARAILGEWLGGSGGGWQDSGGVWPGMKLIEGVLAGDTRGDAEHAGDDGNGTRATTSRGLLLPVHRPLEASPSFDAALEASLVLVHGGMAQNCGPILEMVTEKYLLREPEEWLARHEALQILDQILEAVQDCNIQQLACLTTRNFFGPLQTIIPWATNLYTEVLVERTREHFGDNFWGFWMLGGCSGGGMGFFFRPETKPEALQVLPEILLTAKRELEHALPFAMDPVVYDFSINPHGTVACWCEQLPKINYTINRQSDSYESIDSTTGETLDHLLLNLGFDQQEHESIRANYKNGVIGLAQNRLSMDTAITDVEPHDVIHLSEQITPELVSRGLTELTNGTVGIVTLAAGVGTRWTQGAGCVKALHPFCRLGGRHRSFLEVHLAKNRLVSELAGTTLPHVITTSYMTHGPIQSHLDRVQPIDHGPIYLSRGQTIGLRLIPTVRDLRFAWEERTQQKLDTNAQKVRESGQGALMQWAQECGEASDYRDNLPLQCLHPVGHYYEIPNLLLNGTLRKMLENRPQLKYLMLHNIDTVGANVDPGILGLFAESGTTLSFEVVPRQIHDVGGGLARVNGRPRLVEGIALPREEDEFLFTYYNSMTTWIDIDKLLLKYNLDRHDLSHPSKVAEAVHNFSHRLPTYVTLKEVKKRWGRGHEDVFPTAQFEKIWGDISSLDDVDCAYFVVPRERGTQLKDPAQLDGWLRDGSAQHLDTLCHWDAPSNCTEKLTL